MNFKILFLLIPFLPLSCSVSKNKKTSENSVYAYLALGDSYTIGESVCSTCNYPEQLTERLNKNSNKKTSVKIIAKTGWTTTDLLGAIRLENPSTDYDLVTLLIGVNNQYQGKPFSIYEEEFNQLLKMAIEFANGKKENVIVLSIPDYAYTPFGQQSGKAERITSELKRYNQYAEKTAKEMGIYFQEITDITQQGLENPALVASDGLHPSNEAYSKFVDRMIEKVSKILR
ncbi:SGNH/GDSL hydrolase family protein [Aequorivita echinoideorum]|uniref:SGNH/GDSL hydrolase family protein n=1 Tax=Aequorivita echinoideorum TaxID=1549647 RepID=A0ABS5S0Z8_9FLAO|nr:SGNH/GDSL hydrolase family protein [Aequorivita echinoideorum]MBT0606845.1 SGNH/GDSL hydrolase family protein [Aequorivita echinoideorum]